MSKRIRVAKSPSAHKNDAAVPKAPWRSIISILIAIHLAAIIAEPIRFFTRSSDGRPSAAIDPVRRWLSPYVEFAYLNHGYFFFAPNPGPSHLMDCTLVAADQPERRMRLPNPKAQWPRLLYHRYFMLAEFLNNLFTVPEPPIDAPQGSPIHVEWQRSLRLYQDVLASMENHLKYKYGVENAAIRRVEHRWPTEYEFFELRWRINDERLYWLLPETPAQASEAALPARQMQRDREPVEANQRIEVLPKQEGSGP